MTHVSQEKLAEFVAAAAKEFDVPGVAVGVLVGGEEFYACHGVTSAAGPTVPVPVDEHTLFHLASLSKSYTATALARLAAQGRVDLDAPVRRYVPELRLADERNAAGITVRNLLDHTAGLEWNLIDIDEGDGSLAAFVEKMVELPVIAAPGERASYSQAAYNLAGHVVEKVTALPFEQAIAELVLQPAELNDTVYDLDEVVQRRHVLGHNRDADGLVRTATPWRAYPAAKRGNNPGGGIASTASDVLRWARVHLGDEPALRGMQEPSAELHGSSLADAFGLSWFLKDVAGVRTVGAGGSGNGQFAELLMVPERDFAVVALVNLAPDGYQLNQAVLRFALETFLDLVEEDPEPVPYDHARATEVAGRYEIDAMNLDLAADGTTLTLAVGIKPEIRAASDDEMPQDYPPAAIGFLSPEGDDYLITEGGLKGQRGLFTRDASGTITGIDIAGRLFNRVATDRS